MALLTPEQIEELRRIIRDASVAVSIGTTGMEVSPEEMQRLVDEGYIAPEEIGNLVMDSFEYGRLMAKLPGSNQMTYEQLRTHIEKNPVELSRRERLAYDQAVERAGQFCVGLGTRYSGEVGTNVVQLSEKLAQQFLQGVRGETGYAVARRDAIGGLTTRLRQMSEDWARDWGRIASTESQLAHQQGKFEDVVATHGEDAMMAKVPEPTACKECKKLYLDADGLPQVHPASWWHGQGVSNVGLKRSEWRPVLGAVHPWCFPGGQSVLTARGDIPIELVKVGDVVFTTKRRWRRVTQAHKRFYQGPMVSLAWSDDKQLLCTPNHPLGDGPYSWKIANAIRNGGDLLEVVSPDVDDRPSFAFEKSSLAKILLLFSPAGVPVAAVDFDGNLAFPVAQINTISTNHLIELEYDSATGKSELSHDLIGRLWPTDFVLGSSPDKFVGLLGTANSFVSSSGQRLAFVGGELLHADMLRFAHCAKSDAHLLEALLDGASAHPQLGGYRIYGQLIVDIHVANSLNIESHSLSPERLSLDVGQSAQPQIFAFLGAPQFDATLDESFSDRCVCRPRNSSDGYRDRTVSANKIDYQGYVHNLSVDEDETFHVNGVPSKNCQCQLVRVPAGMEFDDQWNLVPEGVTLKSAMPQTAGMVPKPSDGQGALRGHQNATPTQSVCKAAHKLHYRTTWNGLPISIENRKGSKRYWHNEETDTYGETLMKHPYGYIRMTEAADGDHVDVFIGPNEQARFVYVVHQLKAPAFKSYDEDKVMLGFETRYDAKRAYLAHYHTPKFFGGMIAIPTAKFVERVKARKLANGEMIRKAGPFIGPRGGKWADLAHTIPWKEPTKDPWGWAAEVDEWEFAGADESTESALLAYSAMKAGITPEKLQQNTDNGEQIGELYFNGKMSIEEVKKIAGPKNVLFAGGWQVLKRTNNGNHVFRAKKQSADPVLYSGQHVGADLDDVRQYRSWVTKPGIFVFPEPRECDVLDVDDLDDLAEALSETRTPDEWIERWEEDDIPHINHALGMDEMEITGALRAAGYQWLRFSELSGTTLGYVGVEPIRGVLVARDVSSKPRDDETKGMDLVADTWGNLMAKAIKNAEGRELAVAPNRPPVGTMGNMGKPARNASANLWTAELQEDHPASPSKRKKTEKRKKTKEPAERKKRMQDAADLRYRGWARPMPDQSQYGKRDRDAERNKKWLEDEQNRRAQRSELRPRLTLSSRNLRP